MALLSETSERTEHPTTLRLAEARRRGQVAHSADLTAAAVLVGGCTGLMFAGPQLLAGLKQMMRVLLGSAGAVAVDQAELGSTLASSLGNVLWPLGQIAAIMLVAAVLMGVLQVGLLSSSKVISPQWERISPSQGFAKVFSLRSVVRFALAIMKIGGVILAAWIVCQRQLPRIAALTTAGLGEMLATTGELVWEVILVTLAILLAVGLLDWLYQRWQLNQDLMMTRRELQDDLRKMEGDPLIRVRQRKRMKTGETAN